ncbi:23S rRNA (uracil(1939)-C(5))-methyltransferase RlmD [Methylothermus subterraneus]
MSKRRALPQEPRTATIERLTHDGRGLGYVDGKAVFVQGALPGETVRFKYTDIRRTYALGEVLECLTRSPERASPPCPHFGACGGCALQHLNPKAQLRFKHELLLDQLRRIGKVEPSEIWPPLTGPVFGYRRKARLGVRWVEKKGRTFVGFRERGSGRIAELEACLTLHPKISERIKDLAGLIDRLSLRDRIPQVEVAIGDNRSALVFRVLGPPCAEDRVRLEEFGSRFGFDVYLQPQGPDSLLALTPPDPPWLCYRLPEAITLWFGPLEFTQVNAEINQRLIEQVLAVLDPNPDETVLDLFCGVGNFTLPLARRAFRVVGVEGNPQAVLRARENACLNQIANVEFHCADLSQDLAAFPWALARYDKLLLDPPRSGALPIMDYIPRWEPKRVVYVSCNPATLARDVGHLVRSHGYRLVGAGILDMFPHTAHVESMVLLQR